jgi:hypothetical protein
MTVRGGMTVKGWSGRARWEQFGHIGSKPSAAIRDTPALASVNGDGAEWPFV